MFFKRKGELTRESVLKALGHVTAPGVGRDVVSAEIVRGVEIQQGKVKVDLLLPAGYPSREEVVQACREAVRALPGVEMAFVAVLPPQPQGQGHAHSHSHAGHSHGAQTPRAPAGKQAQGPSRISLPSVRHVIAVASGKGGVGKSTVAVNLAAALVKAGYRVGLMDGDIYGPSLPLMLGVSSRPAQVGDRIMPVVAHGMKTMSMGLVVPPDQPVVWRGPMVHGALTQFLTQVDWGDLDFLLIDMPPGTGDAQLTISQSAPLSGAIIVTTPQEIALIDARKGLKMFQNVSVPILGIVENMSGFVAPGTGQVIEIFRSGGGKRLSEEAGVPLLGSIPIDPRVAIGGDAGRPIVVAHPDSEVGRAFDDVASTVADSLLSTRPGQAPAFAPMSLEWQT